MPRGDDGAAAGPEEEGSQGGAGPTRVALYGRAAVELPAGAAALAEAADTLLLRLPGPAGELALRIRPLRDGDAVEVHVAGPKEGGLLSDAFLKRPSAPAPRAKPAKQRRLSEFAKRAGYAAEDQAAGFALRWAAVDVAGPLPEAGARAEAGAAVALAAGGGAATVYLHGGEVGGTPARTAGDLWALELEATGGPNNNPAVRDPWAFKINSLGAERPAWARVTECDSDGRAGHTLARAPDGKLFAFGGFRLSPEGHRGATQFLNDVEIFDEEASLWFPGFTTGEAPEPRVGHTATALQNGNLLVFGGMMEAEKYLNDVHVLDPSLFNWYRPAVKGAPPKGRYHHSAVRVGSRVVVFGGAGKLNWALKEVHTLDTDSWKWTEHSDKVEGDPPSARVGYAAFAAGDDRHIVVFGGQDPDDPASCYGDLAILDTARWRWMRPQVPYGPGPRAFHTAVVLPAPPAEAAAPGGAAAEPVAAGRKEASNALLVFGGRGADEQRLDDAWLLQL